MQRYASPVTAVREKEPLIQCITNFVTVNDCANIILACGGNASMSHDVREAAESVCKAKGLVCNMGAIERVDSMLLAGKKANEIGVPVVLDPVAAGGTSLRRELSAKLLDEVHFTAIRGNASEIRALAGQNTAGSGVDADALDRVTDDNIESAAELVKALALKTRSVIAVSGKIDLISDGNQTMVLRNGCYTMSRITGSGCMLTALIGAFCAALTEAPFDAVCSAMAVMGIAGEMAEKRMLANGTGNATFRNDLIDAVFNMTEQKVLEGIKYEIL